MLDRVHSRQDRAARAFIAVGMRCDRQASLTSLVHNRYHFFIGEGSFPWVRLGCARALGRQDLDQVHMALRQEPYYASQMLRPPKPGHERVHTRKIKEEVAVPLGKVGTNLVPGSDNFGNIG